MRGPMYYQKLAIVGFNVYRDYNFNRKFLHFF